MERLMYWMLKNNWLVTGKLLMLLLIANTHSQAQVLPLDSVLRLIEGQNPMLREYDYKIKAKETYVQGAGSWEAPRVGAGFFMTPYDKKMADEMTGGEDLGSVMVSVEQMFPNPAQQRAKRAYLQAQSSVERASQDYRFNQLRAEAKKAYYEWVVLEKRQALLNENEEIIRFMIRLAEVRYPYNQSKLNSIYNAQAKLHGLENERLMLQSQIRQKQIALNTLMNRPADTSFGIDTTLTLPTGTFSLADTTGLAAQRSDIKGLEQSIRVMQLNQRWESSMRKPMFGLRYEHMSSIGTMPNQFTLMGMVTIPLVPWASKGYRSNVAAMNYEIEGMRKEQEGILNEARGMLAAMGTEIETKRKQVANYQERIIPALQKNYRVTLQAYEQNTAELAAVIDAWETLNMTQMQYLDTVNELLNMQVTYERELEK
jgi:outer membrane protein, heavy metal efflux system